MTAPPGIEPTLSTTPLRNGGDTKAERTLAFLAREALFILREEGLDISRRAALPIAIEIFEAKQLDLADFRAGVHAEVVKHFRDAVREYARRHKLSACDQRIGGPNWRVTT